MLTIPGFHPLEYTQRENTRGGGVGFFVNDKLNFKRIASLSHNITRTFENLTILVNYPRKPTLFSSIYHSPTPNTGTPHTEHFTQFLNLLTNHLNDLSNTNKPSYIFTDANINLLDVNTSNNANEYFNTVISNGFIPINTKATRIQNNNYSLIDHILCNTVNYTTDSTITGTIVSDISDHFINFMCMPVTQQKHKHQTISTRTINDATIRNFANQLASVSWNDVTACNDTETSFNLFWSTFYTLFELNFPTQTKKLNRNVHKLCNYMTAGLLKSRITKNKLHKIAINEPTNENCLKYRQYRNLYNTILRNSKKLYFEQNLKNSVKNPKRTWDLLKEATNQKTKTNDIKSILINGNINDNKKEMAEEFNLFFSEVGAKISNSVNPTSLEPENFVPPQPEPSCS